MQLVLVVDNDFNDMTNIEYFLTGLRYRVITTTKAKKGLEYAKSAPPDLLVIGLSILDKESIENIALLKKDPITRDSPILGLYRQDDGLFIEKMKKLGVSEYLMKPIDKPHLVAKVNAMLDDSKEKKRLQLSEREVHIEIDRETKGRVIFRFYSGLKKYVAPQLRLYMNKDLLLKIVNDHICIDLRALPDLMPDEMDLLEKIVKLFGSKKINFLAGKHLGPILTHTELEEQVNLFMSPEEYEEYLKSSLV